MSNREAKRRAYDYVAYLIENAGPPDGWDATATAELERIRSAMLNAVEAMVEPPHTNGAPAVTPRER